MAFGLALVFEGMMPFINPEVWRKVVKKIANQENKALRTMGFISMLIGLMVLTLAHLSVT